MTTASSGSRSSRKLTTQSSQASVFRSAQQSQSMVSSPSDSIAGSTSGARRARARLGALVSSERRRRWSARAPLACACGVPGSRHVDDPLCWGRACRRGVTTGCRSGYDGRASPQAAIEGGLQRLLQAPGHALGAHAVGGGDGQERRAPHPVVPEGVGAHDEVDPGAARGVAGQGRDGLGALLPRAPRHHDQAGGAGQAGVQLGQALPEVPAAEAGRREEEEQNRRGGLHHLDPAGDAVGSDADDVVGRRGGVAAVGGDGPEPAQDVGRRLGHGTFDGRRPAPRAPRR